MNNDGSGEYLPLRNLTVRNCRLRSRSFGVKWGTEPHVRNATQSTRQLLVFVSWFCFDSLFAWFQGNMSDILFDNIQIHNAHHGIGIDWRGAGHLTNAVFSNINMLRMSWVGSGSFTDQNWMGAAQSISITNKGGSLLNPNETTGSVSHVRFENITSVSENSAVFVSSCTQTGNSTYDSHGHCTAGLPGSIHDIEFVNVVAVIEQLPSNNASNGVSPRNPPVVASDVWVFAVRLLVVVQPHTSHDDTTGMRSHGPPVDAFFVEMATDVTFTGCSAAFAGQPSVSHDCYNYNTHDGGKRQPDPSGCPNSFGQCLRFGPGFKGDASQSLDACVPPVARTEPSPSSESNRPV